MDVLKLLQGQAAQNRADFAQVQADRSEAVATQPKQWTAQGRDADSGSMAIASSGEAPQLLGRRIASGNIKPGQTVRVNGDGRTVTVDQKPSKQRQLEAASVTTTVQPYWIAFGNGFAVSFDQEAKTFIEAQYPEYSEYSDTVQGEVMFPFGRISCFAAASFDLWVVGGYLDYDRANPPPPQRLRLSLAASTDQGATWQVCEQFIPSPPGSLANWVYSLVWGSGYFFALGASGQLWRSENGLDWELTNLLASQSVYGSLATWNDTVYLLQELSRQVRVYSYNEAQKLPQLALELELTLTNTLEYGAYYPRLFNAGADNTDSQWLNLWQSLYPFLLSSGDLTNIPDYGSGKYKPEVFSVLFLSPSSPVLQRIPCGSNDGQVFLMASRTWRNDTNEGFIAIHEGASWRDCAEHPFRDKIEGDSLSSLNCIDYNRGVDKWVISSTGYMALGAPNGDSWTEPFQPELVTAIARSADISLLFFCDTIKAYRGAGNYVS